MGNIFSIRSSSRLINAAADGEYAADEMRSSFQLVQTCHQDLQNLVELRNMQMYLLKGMPKALQKVNYTIQASHKSLAEARHIVDKCRAETKVVESKPSLRRRVKWVTHYSTQFQSHEPSIRHHQHEVLLELSFLRQLVATEPRCDEDTTRNEGDDNFHTKESAAFEDAELLNDLMGEISSTIHLDFQFVMKYTNTY